MQGKVTSHIIKGLIISAVLIVVDIAGKKAGDNMNVAVARWAPVFIMITGFIFSAWFYAKQMEGKVTFGNVFAHGFKTAAVVIFMLALYTYITVKFIDPPYSAKEIEDLTKEYQKQGSLMPAEAKERATMYAQKAWIFALSGVLFIGLLLGVIGSATGAAIAKKNQ